MTRPMDELDDTIEAWWEMFDYYKIPVDAYRELYQRAFEFRQFKIRQGQDCPTMDCTLLISQWTGENGLAALRRNTQKIGADKQLYGESYAPKCSWCLDLGKILTGPRKGQPCPHRD
jgi:hypothetical protein